MKRFRFALAAAIPAALLSYMIFIVVWENPSPYAPPSLTRESAYGTLIFARFQYGLSGHPPHHLQPYYRVILSDEQMAAVFRGIELPASYAGEATFRSDGTFMNVRAGGTGAGVTVGTVPYAAVRNYLSAAPSVDIHGVPVFFSFHDSGIIQLHAGFTLGGRRYDISLRNGTISGDRVRGSARRLSRALADDIGRLAELAAAFIQAGGADLTILTNP
jgi:hypothetical protein